VSEARIKVTHVVFDLDGGGLESFVGNTARHYAGRAGAVDVSIVTLSGRVGRLGEQVRELVDAFVVLDPMPIVSMIAPRSLIAALTRLAPHVVHLHSGAWYKPALAARRARVPVTVFTEHGREHDDPWQQRMLDRVAARWTDAIVAVSDRLEGYLIETVGVPRDRVSTITNGVDVERFAPTPQTTTGRRLVVGAVGRLAHVKGQDVLIDAAALLRAMDDLPPFEIVIAGDGPDRAALGAAIAARGLTDLVRLVGWSDDPAALYRQLDVYALPSRSEGTSISLLEAMASGAAPVVTDVGSNAALLGPHLRAQVVPPENPAALAQCLADTLRSPARRHAVAGEARARAVAHYDWRQTMAAYEAVYRRCLAGTPIFPQ
jgi:glycosyltransferase involved in cell wall biosynthesis